MSMLETNDMRTKTKTLLAEFLNVIKGVQSLKTELPFQGLNYADKFCKCSYNVARYMHLYPNYLELLTNEDKSTLKDHFQSSFAKVGYFVPYSINGLEPQDLNLAKRKISEFTFLKNEMIELYTKACDGDKVELTDGVKTGLKNIDNTIRELNDMLDAWLDPNCLYTEEDPDQVPTLNGVPESHTWWSSEQRKEATGEKN